MALSIVAAITGNLYKSRDLADRLAKAQTAATLLEGLATSLEFGTVSLEEATRQYQQYLTGIPFIPEKSSPAQPAGV